jgi:SAM-dependent methyltransferase
MPISSSDRVRLWISRSTPYLRARDLVMHSGRDTYWVVREDLARRYLSGEGIEIGALAAPLRLPPGVRVRYVDHMDRDGLLAAEGPGLAAAGVDPGTIVDVDVVADAERLHGIADGSVDYVVAAHVLEHVEDPVLALRSLARVTRPGGHVLIVLPDPRFTFDRHRARTSLEHVLADHAEGPEYSRAQHRLEWACDIEGLNGDSARKRADEFAVQEARHHFHVWELSGFLELLAALELPYEIVHAQAYAKEFAVVLTVTGPLGADRRD